MSNVPTNLIPTRITGLPEYLGSSTLGYLPYILDGRSYKVQFANIAAVGAVPSTREINTGSGLGGGGDLSANRTLYILPGGVDDSRLSVTGVTAGTYGAADSIPVFTVNAQGRVTGVTDTPIVLTNYVPTSRTISAGAGLTGGGDLSANRSFAVNFSSTTPEPLGPGTPGVSTAAARGDHVHPAVDLSDTTETQGVLPLSRGGTGNSLSPVVGAIAYSSNDKLYLTPTAGSVGQVLTSIGGTGAPIWTTLTGTGTVTDVSVVTANGFAGTVANPNTVPAITMQTTVSGMIKGNGTSISAATAGTDYVEPGAITTSGLTMATDRLLGRTTASAGAVEQITVGTGLLLSGGSLTNSAPDQTVSLTGGTAISISGTYPSFTITNTAPDQIVSLTGAGTTSITGTYPNFTITSNDQYVGTVTSVSGTGTVNGLTLTGTVTSSGSLTLGGTLSNVSLTSQVTGTLPVANGGTGATVAGTARTNLGAAASGANTDITSIALTTGTISATPTSGTDIVNKTYADSIASGINFHQAVRLATAAALPANTYNNGASGVGATLTANANGALTVDGVAAVAGNRILVKNEVTQANNGVYTVTQVGSAGTPYILTRATDFDSSGSGVDQIDAGDFFLVTAGSTQANTSWVQQTPLPIVVGTTALVFTQFAAPVLYSAGTGLTLAGTVFSITNTGVSASTYGSASSVPVLAINAQGQVTSASNSSIAINASQITTGTVTVAQGGTGATTLGANGVLLGNGTSAISATAVGTTGQVLVGNTGAAPTWATLSGIGVTSFSGGTTGFTPSTATTGAITLAGTLNVANGGTGATTLSSGYVLKGNGTSAVSASVIYDTGTNVGIGTSSPTFKLQVSGNLYTSSNVQFYDQDGFRFASSAAYTSLRMGSAYTGESTGELAYDRTTGAFTYKQGNTGSALTERMRIDSSGNVGIGTSSPGAKIEVQTTGAYSAYFQTGVDQSSNVALRRISLTAINFRAAIQGQILSGTWGADDLLINPSGGNVGIGTTSPAARLHVVNSTVNAQFRLQDVTTDATNKYGVVGTGHYTNAQSPILAVGVGSLSASNTVYIGGGFGSLNAATAIQFFTAANNTTLTGTERMRIDGTGQVGIGVTPMATGANGNLLQIGNPTTSAGSGLTIGSTATADIQFSDATTGAGQYAGLIRYSHSTDHMALWTASAERMRIDSSGNVGIGISPTAKLHVAGTIQSSSGSSTAQMFSDGTAAYFTSVGAFPAIFSVNGAERMRIDTSGNVGIGTTPSVRLDVNNGAASVEQWIRTGTGFSSTLFLKPNGSGGGLRFQAEAGQTATIYNTLNSPLTFGTNNTERMRIDSSGSVTASVDVRAPIFYDSNNTAYFIDPASGSTLGGQLNQYGYLNIAYGGSAYSGMGISNTYASASNFATSFIDFTNESNRQKASIFGNFGTDGSGYLQFLATAAGVARNVDGRTTVGYAYSNQWQFLTSSGITANIYYDQNNTAYYLDPNSTSNLVGLTVANTINGFVTGCTFAEDSVNKDDITTRSDSGFYQSSSGTTAEGWPINDGNWQHMISCTHTNDSNYFAMQLGASFFSQGLFYRSTAGSGTTGWSRVALYGNGYAAPLYASTYYDADNTAAYIDPAGASWIKGGFQMNVPSPSNDCFGGLEMREAGLVANTQTAATYAPGINFHWGSIAAARIYMASSGAFVLGAQGDITNGRRTLFCADLNATGNVTAYYSDERLKTRIGKIDNALDIVSKLSGFRYVNNDLAKSFGYEGDEVQLGVSAQEVEAVLPEVVRQAAFDIDLDDPDGGSKSGENYKTVQYDRLVPLLIEAIKELTNKVKALEAKE